jgi:Zn-dependent oligopeptidase
MDIPQNIEELDKKVLEFVNKYSLFERDWNYKMYTAFWHIFWWWYAAWYYSYMWAEILEADVFEKIKEMWMFDRNNWEKFIKTILWQGTRKNASELFYDFMWREVDDTAFLKRKWF